MTLALIIIIILSLSPAIFSWWQMRQFERRIQHRLDYIATHGVQRSFSFANTPPEFRYIEGVGYVIGNLSCKFNARSPYMRCAVNPLGPCEGCSSYQTKL